MSLQQSEDAAAAVAKAPRVTLEDLNNKIASEVSARASDLFKDVPADKALECLTICVITMRNGFTFVGKSACASPENFDADLGHKFAREDAVRQAWAFEGYLLRERLYWDAPVARDPAEDPRPEPDFEPSPEDLRKD